MQVNWFIWYGQCINDIHIVRVQVMRERLARPPSLSSPWRYTSLIFCDTWRHSHHLYRHNNCYCTWSWWQSSSLSSWPDYHHNWWSSQSDAKFHANKSLFVYTYISNYMFVLSGVYYCMKTCYNPPSVHIRLISIHMGAHCYILIYMYMMTGDNPKCIYVGSRLRSDHRSLTYIRIWEFIHAHWR